MMCASTIDRYGHIYSQEEGGGAAYEGVIASLDQTTSGKACQIFKNWAQIPSTSKEQFLEYAFELECEELSYNYKRQGSSQIIRNLQTA